MDFDKLGVQVLFVCMTSKSNNSIIFLINISRHSSSINLNYSAPYCILYIHILQAICISSIINVVCLFVCLFVAQRRTGT